MGTRAHRASNHQSTKEAGGGGVGAIGARTSATASCVWCCVALIWTSSSNAIGTYVEAGVTKLGRMSQRTPPCSLAGGIPEH
jgi:hypothetical protein